MKPRHRLPLLLTGGVVVVVVLALLTQRFSQTSLLRERLSLVGPTATPSPADSLNPAATLPEGSPPPAFSVPYPADAPTGTLAPQYDQYSGDGLRLVGWTYQDQNIEHACTAGPDGIWTACSFSPTAKPWPAPVPKKLLQTPPTAPPPSGQESEPVETPFTTTP